MEMWVMAFLVVAFIWIFAGAGPENDLWWLLIILGILFVSWVMYGGPEKESSRSGFFLNPPAPLSDGRAYGDPPWKDLLRWADENPSPSFDYVTVASMESAKSNSSADNESITIRFAGNKSGDVDITGWTLVNGRGERVVIGKGVKLFKQGEDNQEEDIVVKNGESVIFVSGESPNGHSFKMNSCSGYLAQFQTYSPPLPASCPSPGSDISLGGVFGPACRVFAQTIPLCTMAVSGQTLGLETMTTECRREIAQKISYNGCIQSHSAEKDFSIPEWRVYLGLKSDFWSNDHDRVILMDKEERLVAGTEY